MRYLLSPGKEPYPPEAEGVVLALILLLQCRFCNHGLPTFRDRNRNRLFFAPIVLIWQSTEMNANGNPTTRTSPMLHSCQNTGSIIFTPTRRHGEMLAQ